MEFIQDLLYIMTAIFAMFFILVVLILITLFPAVSICIGFVAAVLFVRYKGNYS